MSTEFLRAAVANSPAVLFMLDRDGLFALSEGEGLDALSLKPGEAVGRSAFDIYRDEPAVVGNNWRAPAGEAFSATVEVAGRAFETSYGPLRGEDGAASRVSGLAAGITERKQAEESLWTQNKS